MTKTTKTAIDANLFETILGNVMNKNPGTLSVVAQKGWVKISGPHGRKLYVARTKSVSRAALSGFHLNYERGLNELPEDEKCGRVTQLIDFSLTPPEILATFENILLDMIHLAPPAPQAKPTRATPKKQAVVGWSALLAPTPSTPETPAKVEITENEIDEAIDSALPESHPILG